MKLANNNIEFMFGLTEDEDIFFTLAFMKDGLHSWLG
jgi:hypothetical protein